MSTKSSPIAVSYSKRDIIAWNKAGPVDWDQFLRYVDGASKRLPDKGYVINLCSDPYWFIVSFAAALTREQITLLPSRRDNKSLERLARAYGDAYCVSDGSKTADCLQCCDIRRMPASQRPLLTIASIPQDRVVVIAFTSGTTDQPKANIKTWGSLVGVARRTAKRLKIGEHGKLTIAATVPPSHMFGLEASVMLPLQHGMSILFPRPFFPEDIRIALQEIPSPKALITTPLHLRACLAERAFFPGLEFILSATSCLSRPLALEAETAFKTKIVDLYGFTEAGSVATRLPVVEDEWHLLDNLTLSSTVNGSCVRAPYFNNPVPIPDIVEPLGRNRFLLQGRNEDLVKIAGRRASLDELNRKLNEVPGVKDAVFVSPFKDGDRVARLVAFIVAPGKTSSDILACLREKIERPFLPRDLIFVSSLPRNETGKITREALDRLLISCDRRDKKRRHSIGFRS